MKQLIKPFNDQYNCFLEEITSDNCENIVIGTLGPEGTSSEFALRYFISNIESYNSNIKCDVFLATNFNTIYNALNDNLIKYALVPTAYEKITDFFWNNDFINNLNFIFPTPQYGMVCKNDYRQINDRKVRIACCAAVENTINYLSNGIFKNGEFQKVQTNSTTEAIKSLIDGYADLAITNKTSFDIYSDKDIKFISKTYNANMVWSVFKQKIIQT